MNWPLIALALAALSCALLARSLSYTAPGVRYRVGLVAFAAFALPLLLVAVVVVAVLVGHYEAAECAPDELSPLHFHRL